MLASYRKCILGHLRLQGLKDSILDELAKSADKAEEEKNSEAYAELIQFLNDKSLSLVMRDAADDGQKALQIFEGLLCWQEKAGEVSLYTELTLLQKMNSESVTKLVLHAETVITALRIVGETLSVGLFEAMILKGLPESFKPFTIYVTQSNETMVLRSYEDKEKMHATATNNSIMMA